MQLEQTLTKENFWNEMMEKYPKAAKSFCEWIDEYKKAVGWNGLFRESNSRDENGDIVGGTKKYHELPYAMQYGIWIEFCRQNLHQFFEQSEHLCDFVDLEEDVKNVFKEIDPMID
jgi:hypothetical protein